MAKDDAAATNGGAEDKKQAEGKTQQDATTPVQVKLDPIELLKADHRRVEQLFKEFETADESRKGEIVKQVCLELTIHTLLEEEIFYPACREATDDEEPLNEAQVEHDAAKMLIMDLMAGRSDDPFRDAKVKVLAEEIKHHVGEEEAPTKGIFAKAKAAGFATAELADELQSRKRELQAQGRLSSRVRPVALQPQGQQPQAPRGRTQENDMAYQDRDERGRFTSDDDDRGRSGGGRSYSARGGGGSRSYRDDDGDRGWYGDSRGHSEAARKGWETRRGESRSFRDDDDDDRRSYRSSERDQDGRGSDRDRDERGRFVSDDDDRRYASSRGRYSDDDRGRGRYSDDDRGGYRSSSGRSRDDDDGRGWYGDSRGHAEAARKGWETRREEDDDDRGRYRSRGRDDDRDYRDRDRGQDRGQGGWFGDSRGHAEAARRGWDNRR